MRPQSFSSTLSGALTDLVAFALRSQYELARLTGPVANEASPRYRVYEFTVHDGIAGALVHCELDNLGEFLVRVTQSGRTYEAKLPFKGESIADLKATVKLSEKELVLDTQLEGEAFLAGEGIPESFQALHRLVVRHSQRNLGWLMNGTSSLGKERLDTADKPPQPDEVSQTERAVGQLFKTVTAHAKFACDELLREFSSASSEPKETVEFRDVRIARTNEPDLQFSGKPLGHVRSHEKNGRFWAYTVFETAGGNLVAVKEGFSRWMGEAKRSETLVTKDRQELLPFFGSSPLARALYVKLGLDHVTIID
jgi:hypothetical protein